MNTLDGRVIGYSDEIIRCAKELLSIDSVKGEASGEYAPFGDGIKQSLDYFLGWGSGNGFLTKNVDGYAGHLEIGQGDELIGILVHLDVVPAGAGWSVPPFAGTVIDGKLFGRGAVDDKGPAVAAMYAMKAVKESGIKLSKRVRIIAGTDEESGWGCMDHYFLTEEKPAMGFAPDAEFPIINGEKGICTVAVQTEFADSDAGKVSSLSICGGDRVNVVPEECVCEFKSTDNSLYENLKTLVSQYTQGTGRAISVEKGQDGNIRLIAHGKAAHGSLPHMGVNAIAIMVNFIVTSTTFLPDRLMDALRWIDSVIGFETDGTRLGIACQHAALGNLTVNLGTLNAGSKSIRCELNMRHPLGIDVPTIVATITEHAAAVGLGVEDLRGMEPIYSSPDSPLVQGLTRAYQAVTGEKAELVSIGGTTYAKALPMGVAFGPLMPGREELAHQKDEYIYVEDLINAARIYARAIVELAG